MILDTGLTQKYREEAQSIADEIYDKYDISCGIGESANEANNNIDNILNNIDYFHSWKLYMDREKARADRERLRRAGKKWRGEMKDNTVKFGAHNI